MGWTTPKTDWANFDVPSSQDFNTYVRDNELALKDPVSAVSDIDEALDYTTTSTTFENVDATEGKFQHTIVSTGGDLFVGFMGVVTHNGSGYIYFDVAVTGTPQGGDDGIIFSRANSTADRRPVFFVYMIQGLTADTTYVITLQWKVSGGLGTLYAGQTATYAVHPKMWMREMT
jgi:hypothetical protein